MIERRLVDHDTHLLWFDAHRGDRGIGQCTTEVALLLLRSAFTEHDRDNRHSLSSPSYVFASDLTGDDPLLDLVRPFVDFRDFLIAVNFTHMSIATVVTELTTETVPTKHLNCLALKIACHISTSEQRRVWTESVRKIRTWCA